MSRAAAQGDCMYRHIKLAFAATISLGFLATGLASAADMAVKARPVVAPLMYNWQGCYIGGNAGGYKARDLAKEIDLLLNEADPKKALPHKLRETVDTIRHFGNFSAHPIDDKTTLQVIDVEPEEKNSSSIFMLGLPRRL